MSERYADRVMPYAPWHKPSVRQLGAGVTVETEYGSHVLAALLYGLWRVLVRRECWFVSAGRVAGDER